MVAATGFKGHVDGGFSEANSEVLAVIESLDDIRVLARDGGSQTFQCTGAILKTYPDSDTASVTHEAAFDDPREEIDIDIAT